MQLYINSMPIAIEHKPNGGALAASSALQQISADDAIMPDIYSPKP